MWIRAHLVPARHATSALDLSRLQEFTIVLPSRVMKVVSGANPGDAWVLSNNTITSTGRVFTGPADHPDAAPVATAVKTKRKAKHMAKAAPAETQSAETAKPAAHGKTAHAKAAHAKPARTETTKTAAAKKTKPKPAAVAQ